LAESTPRFYLVLFAFSSAILSVIGYMMARGIFGQRRENLTYRIPPELSPEMESTYSFRAYMTDNFMWIMLANLQPHQQCAAIIMRLGGAAREMARRSAREEGMLVGISSGATLAAIAQKLPALPAGATVLGFNYDTGERYLSVEGFLPQ
jgi:hypothetical protein